VPVEAAELARLQAVEAEARRVAALVGEGGCDVGQVIDAVERLARRLAVLKSSTPPGATRS
jgi:hypothetical protein